MNRLYSWRFWIAANLFFSFCCTIKLQAQGSYDTGVSSIPAFKPVKEIFAPGKNNRMSFGMSAGAADYSIFVLTPEIGYSRLLAKHFSVDGRVTAAWHSGNGVSTFGLGDVFVNLNYLPFAHFSITGGIKICTNRASKFYTDEIAYPMDYQSTIGTIDLIAGIAYHPGKWHLTAIWEHPFVQNLNWFYPDEWEHPESPFNNFPGTFGFIRKGDILFSLARTIPLSEKISITPGVLPVYHITEDELPELNTEGYIFVSGSKGLTLNITVLSNIQVNEKSNLEINLGFPVVERDVQLEGLKRSFVIGAEYINSF